MNNLHQETTSPNFNGLLANIRNGGWCIQQESVFREERPCAFKSLKKKKEEWKYSPKSNIDRSKTLNRDEWNEKGIVVATSDFKEKYEAAKNRIVQLCENSEDEYAPNQIAQRLALYALDLLKNCKVVPSLINSTDEESLIFEFFTEDKYYLIEFYNSGEIIYLRRIEGQPKFVTETTVNGVKEIIKDITRAYTK